MGKVGMIPVVKGALGCLKIIFALTSDILRNYLVYLTPVTILQRIYVTLEVLR